MDDLICEIRSLLELGYEGGYWDFKSDYPDKNKKEDKLHDIICMANNLEDRDAYLIYGANDDGTIKGIQNTEKQRLKTADFIKFLRDKNFAGGFIPDIKLQTIVIDNNELDILIIRRGKHTPYYLQKDYYESSPKEKLRAGAIYTRTADINTPKECTANVEHTEYLWRKHFGYDLSPSKRFDLILSDVKGWSDCNWDTVNYMYYINHPEYKIVSGQHKDGYELLAYFYDDERMLYSELKFEYLTTIIYESELWFMDMERCIIPKPEIRYIIGKGLFYYFLKDSMNGKLNSVINRRNYCCNRSGIEIPVMFFDNKKEFEQFEEWFQKSGYENVEHKRKKLIKNAIIQHILEKENRDGRPDVGILEIAACYWIYKDWRMQKHE